MRGIGRGWVGLWVLLLPLCAEAGIGKISALEGGATRVPKGQSAGVALAVGADVELEDTLKVAKGGALKLTLNDESVLALGPGSELFIAVADFEGQNRKGFLGKLNVGSLWTNVKKALAGSDAKFEVQTERAVAGVRGTIFRVDAVKTVKGTKPRAASTVVKVLEGKVAVEAQVKKTFEPPAGGKGAPGQGEKKERKQIAGPKQISKDEWEKRFVELQRGMEIRVGEALWEEASFDPDAKTDDALSRFVDRHP